MTRPSPADAGFGVVELVIIAALVAVLAAVSVPSISAARDGYELVTSGANVAAKFGEARTNALKRNRPTWVLSTPGTQTLQVQMAGPTGNVDIGWVQLLPARVTIITPVAQALLRFDTMGRPVDAAGILAAHVIQLRHTGTQQVRTITVGTTGRVTIN